MKSNINNVCGTFRLAPHGQPDFIKFGNAMQVKCKTEGVSGNARQRRAQVRSWKRQGLRVTPGNIHWELSVVEIRELAPKPRVLMAVKPENAPLRLVSSTCLGIEPPRDMAFSRKVFTSSEN